MRGLLGHSDGDVLLHAISDAVLGAAGADDIGVHFPNTDKAIEGIASERILARCSRARQGGGYEIVNVDAVVVCEAPKIQPYSEEMRANIARIMAVESRGKHQGQDDRGHGLHRGGRRGIESLAVCLSA